MTTTTTTKTKPAKKNTPSKSTKVQTAEPKVRRGRPTKIQTFNKTLKEGEELVRLWEFRSRKNGAEIKMDIVDQQQAKARSLTGLHNNPRDQVRLIKLAQDADKIVQTYPDPEDFETRKLVNKARDLRSRSKALFILCHTGFIEKFITPHINRFDNARGDQSYSNTHDIREDLRAAAQAGVDIGILRFDCDSGLRPMTYMRFWMHHKVGQEVEMMSKSFRAKGKTSDLVSKIEEVVKEIRTEGRNVTLEEVAEKTNSTVNRISQVFPLATEMPIRLDGAPNESEDEKSSIGEFIVDPKQSVEDPVLESANKEWLVQAVDRLDNNFHKRVISLYYGIGDEIGVPQHVLYDGVYVDKDKNRFSAEPSVLEDKDRRARGEKITQEKQSVLNRKFKAGELVFEPGSSEAHELSRISQGPVDLDGTFDKYVTSKTGVPPRSGTIQNAIKEATKALQKMAADEGMAAD